MGQLGQAPEPGQDGGFLNRGTTLKVISSGEVVLTKPANNAAASINVQHSLGYIPAFMAFLTQSAVVQLLPTITLETDGKVSTLLVANVDDEYLNFFVTTPSTGTSYSTANTFAIKYYLFAESSST